MKIALISDVHANLEALTACHRHAQELGVAGYVGLGDFVNYGAEPNACLDLLRTLPEFIAVLGNHDASMFRDLKFPTQVAVRQAADWTRAQLSDDNIGFLKALPMIAQRYTCAFVHASAQDPDAWTYVTNVETALASIEASPCAITFIGHTHVPTLWYETNGAVRELTPTEGVSIPLRARGRYLIGVGSVGQPRDGSSASCYAIFDTKRRELTFHRVPYDYAQTAKKILAAGLPSAFADRLAWGK